MAKKPVSQDELEIHLDLLSELRSDAMEALALNDYRRIRRSVDYFLQENDMQVDRESDSYRKLCREMLKTHVRFLEIEQKRAVGDYSEEEKLTIGSSYPRKPPEEPSGETLSKVIDLYRAEQIRADRWTKKTEAEVMAILRLFSEIVGDVAAKSIDHKLVREYKQTLMKLPPNMKKSPKYRDKSAEQILQMEGVKPMSITSVNKHLVRVSSLFKYAAKNGFMSSNPAEGMQITTSKRDDEYRDVFDAEDLRKLFFSDEYLKDIHRNSYGFWIPVLGLLTGCRLEELAQLHLADIRREDVVWVIDINNEGDKSVKTKASLRIVPIHPILLDDLRFLDYVESLKMRGEFRLFPELRKRRDGYGQTVSKWFARYKKRCGIVEEGKKKDFHSFRHTFVNALKQNREVDSVMISEIVGHLVDSITMGRYGKRYNARALFEVIKKVKYDVDLSHLNRSKFVSKKS